MSLLPKIISRLVFGHTGTFHSLTHHQTGSSINQVSTPLVQIVRTKIRCHFPRPSERKRVTKHGWQKRLSTPEGRRVIMNRILKGKWVLSH